MNLRPHPALNDDKSALKPTLQVAALSPAMPSILNLYTRGPLPLLGCVKACMLDTAIYYYFFSSLGIENKIRQKEWMW